MRKSIDNFDIFPRHADAIYWRSLADKIASHHKSVGDRGYVAGDVYSCYGICNAIDGVKDKDQSIRLWFQLQVLRPTGKHKPNSWPFWWDTKNEGIDERVIGCLLLAEMVENNADNLIALTDDLLGEFANSVYEEGLSRGRDADPDDILDRAASACCHDEFYDCAFEIFEKHVDDGLPEYVQDLFYVTFAEGFRDGWNDAVDDLIADLHWDGEV